MPRGSLRASLPPLRKIRRSTYSRQPARTLRFPLDTTRWREGRPSVNRLRPCGLAALTTLSVLVVILGSPSREGLWRA